MKTETRAEPRKAWTDRSNLLLPICDAMPPCQHSDSAADATHTCVSCQNEAASDPSTALGVRAACHWTLRAVNLQPKQQREGEAGGGMRTFEDGLVGQQHRP